MSSTGPKQSIYKSLSEVAQALGHPHRLELLEHLAKECAASRSFPPARDRASRIRRATWGFSGGRDSQASAPGRHRASRRAHPLSPRRRYRTDRADQRAWSCRRAEHGRDQPRDDGLLPGPRFEPVSRDDLVSRLHEGSVTVLDVRPQDGFAVGHLPGALNIPLAELERRLGEPPANREVIAALLRSLLRGGRSTQGARLSRSPAPRRLSRMESRRTAGQASRLNKAAPAGLMDGKKRARLLPLATRQRSAGYLFQLFRQTSILRGPRRHAGA